MNGSTPNLKFVDVAEDNIHDVEHLMRQQAAHHGYTYEGETEIVLKALSGDEPVMNAFLVYTPDLSEKAVCCVLYREAWTFEGKRSYLEDICTDVNYRGGGIGKFAVAETARRSLAAGIDMITGAVAKNNTATIAFWIKGGGRNIPQQGYGLTNLFNDCSALQEKTSYTAKRITNPDSTIPAHLHPAVKDPTTAIFAINNSKGKPAALVLANAKFSADSSACPGVLVEPVKFLHSTNTAQKQSILKTALSAVHDFACKKGYTDHLYVLADVNCEASKDYLNKVGTGPRQSSDDPESLLISMEMPIGHFGMKP